MNLLKNLNFNFTIIYIIHKTLVLLKNNLSYLRNCIFEYSFKEYKGPSFFKKKGFFHII